MRKLVLAAAVSVSLAGVTSQSIALGLGEIAIFSSLNQNLDAEVGLVDVAGGQLNGATASLASEAAFRSAGLTITPVLRSLRFNVEQRPDGESIVKVSSDAPVVEPFLNFLLEVESSSVAPQVREYTVLLDPPAFPSTQIAAVTSQSQPVMQEVVRDNTDLDLSDAAYLDGGTEVDFSSVAVDEVESLPELIYTEDEVLQLGSDQNMQARGASLNLPEVSAGEDIDLNAEFLERTDDVVVGDVSDGADVALDELAESAIFTDEFSSDAEVNVVDLGSLSNESQPVGAVVAGDSVRSTGLSVDLDDVDSDALAVEVEGVLESVVEPVDEIPQVTLEAVETTVIGEPEVVPSITEGVVADAQPADADSATLTTNVLVVEMSEVDDDVTLPELVIVDPLLDTAATDTQSTDQIVVTQVDGVLGESVDISGVIRDLEGGAVPTVETAVEALSVTDAATYTVSRQDTLWSIASRTKPAGMSTRQMMARILEANDSAFLNGDMNSMRSGAVLTLPGVTSDVVASTTADATSGTTAVSKTPGATIKPVVPEVVPVLVETAPAVDTTVAGNTSNAQLSDELDEVNKRMVEAQQELTSEAEQRTELSNRVGDLEDSLTSMKELITLRESELTDLQNGLTTPEVSEEQLADEAAEQSRELQVAQSEDTAGLENKIQERQEQISENATIAQERVEAQADADRNLASAEAQAQSLRLANEEDALKMQLAMLSEEKAQLEATAQADKLALVQQAEAEKAQLLASASAERDRIRAELESEKTRITEEAAAERARIATQAETEKQQLLADGQAERDRLAAEGEQMRVKLETLQEEKSELLAQAKIDQEQLAQASIKAEEGEQAQAKLQAEAEAEKKKFEEESSRVKDKLAALQAEANANLATSAGNDIDRSTNSENGVDITTPALVGGGLAVAATPLERVLGDRKQVLAAGGGLALLGLLGAWAVRRRKAPAVREQRVDNYRDDGSMGTPVATRFDTQRGNQYEEVNTRSAESDHAVEEVASNAEVVEAAAAEVAREPEVQSGMPVLTSSVDDVQANPIVDELVDDTITEADVYLRYGLHGQAEDLLKGAIEKSPDVQEYQVKLLESYHDQKNTAEFKTTADNFKNRFGESPFWERIAGMGRDLDSSDSTFSRVGAMGAATAGVAATATAAVISSGSNAADAVGVDDTIDISADFNVADLEATGDLTDMLPDDLNEVSLDEVDLAALDDDGTLNLEEIAGDQMSGLDLGTLDLTNPDGDSTLDNLTLDDADLNSLGDLTSSGAGAMSDLDLDSSGISRVDEMETMLDLAKAYIDMGDSDSAKGALSDIIGNGSNAQKMEAQDLLSKLK